MCACVRGKWPIVNDNRSVAGFFKEDKAAYLWVMWRSPIVLVLGRLAKQSLPAYRKRRPPRSHQDAWTPGMPGREENVVQSVPHQGIVLRRSKYGTVIGKTS